MTIIYTLLGVPYVAVIDPVRGVVLQKAARKRIPSPGQMSLFGSNDPKEGDTKVENGVTYRLNQNSRWERTDKAKGTAKAKPKAVVPVVEEKAESKAKVKSKPSGIADMRQEGDTGSRRDEVKPMPNLETESRVISDDGDVTVTKLGRYAHKEQNPHFWVNFLSQMSQQLRSGRDMTTAVRVAASMGEIYGATFTVKTDAPLQRFRMHKSITADSLMAEAQARLSDDQIQQVMELGDPIEQMKAIGRERATGVIDEQQQGVGYKALGAALYLSKKGDTKTVNGVTYELSGEPVGWHRVEEPTPEPTPVAAEVVMDEPKPKQRLGDRMRAIAQELRQETEAQKQYTARMLGAAAQLAQNQDNLIDEVVDMVNEDLDTPEALPEPTIGDMLAEQKAEEGSTMESTIPPSRRTNPIYAATYPYSHFLPGLKGSKKQKEWALVIREDALRTLWSQGFHGTTESFEQDVANLPDDASWWIDNRDGIGQVINNRLGLAYSSPAGSDY